MTISFSSAQRKLFLGMLGFFAVASVLSMLAGQFFGGVLGGAVGVGIALRSKVVLHEADIEIHAGLRRIRVPWADVANVERKQHFGAERVALRLQSGRTRWLPVPYSGAILSNPDFSAQGRAIHDAWRAATGRSGAAPGAGFGPADPGAAPGAPAGSDPWAAPGGPS